MYMFKYIKIYLFPFKIIFFLKHQKFDQKFDIFKIPH